jgi:hypothetical protein
MLSKALHSHFKEMASVVAIIYEDKIWPMDHEESHSHEEADALLARQVLVSLADGSSKDIYVWS